MVSLPDGKTGNNALGYCSSASPDPARPMTLTPIGAAWPKRLFPGAKLAVKWLKLPGQPEFLHVLDGETAGRLPRRFKQRATADLVEIRTHRSQHYAPGVALYYGTASAMAGNIITVTPLGRWLYDLPVGAAVEVVNLSAPGNALKNGAFGSQAAVAKHSAASAAFLKDSPGG
jgi:hypothetical protein